MAAIASQHTICNGCDCGDFHEVRHKFGKKNVAVAERIKRMMRDERFKHVCVYLQFQLLKERERRAAKLKC